MSRSSQTRRPWPALVGAALLLALAACGGGGSDKPPTTVTTLDPDAEVTITWWHGQNAEAAALLEGLADEYMADHPNVTIESSSGASTTDGLLQKLQAGFASDTFPDISYAFGNWATELGVSGRTLDISSFVQEPDSGWDEFPAAATATATVGDEVIGMPAVVDDLSLIYNTDLFDAAGLDYPTPDWTWDDFRAAAKALTDPSRNIYGTAYPISGTEDTVWRFWPQLWQNGGDVLDSEGMPAFDSQAGVDALELWRAMAVDDKSVYLDQNGEKYADSFESGNIGMMISGPWELYDMKKAKTPYGVQILPGTDGNHQTISGPDLWVLFDQGDKNRAAAAYDFINWLTSPAQDVRWNVAYGNLPLRASAADTPEFQQYLETYPGGDVMFANLENATTPRPTVVGYSKLSEQVGKAIGRVLLGAEDPQQALSDAADGSRTALQQGLQKAGQ
jgi:multiple sugar transport system substrate-binding protein